MGKGIYLCLHWCGVSGAIDQWSPAGIIVSLWLHMVYMLY